MLFTRCNCYFLWLSLRQARQNGVESIEVVSSKSNVPDSTAVTTSLMAMAVSTSYSSVNVDRFESPPGNPASDGCSIFITRRPRDRRPLVALGSRWLWFFRYPTGCRDAVYFLNDLCLIPPSLLSHLTISTDASTITDGVFDISTC